ncbi:MAG: hypothetical protein HOQ11_11500 [Gemmatimonadaceae bacterium]|nr:hypothetical protein [Gemmatimonadaceae bacterium]
MRNVPPGTVFVRNSGSYWKCSPAACQPSTVAGLSGVVSSNSVSAPPVEPARAPSWPVG